MGRVSLEDLQKLVYTRMGDKAGQATPSSGSYAELAAVTAQIDRQVRALVQLAESLDYWLIWDSAQIPVGPDYAVQVVTISGTPTGGTVLLTIGGVFYAAAYNASAATIQTAMNANLPLTMQVVVTGGPGPGTPWTFTFPAASVRSHVPLMTAVSSLTGGTSPSVAVTGTAGSFGREYDLDLYMRDSSQQTNWRCRLFVERTEFPAGTVLAKPQRCWLQEQGDFRVRDASTPRDRFTVPGLERERELSYDYGGRVQLYRRGQTLGFHVTPTTTQVLQAWWVPHVPKLPNSAPSTEYLGYTLGLPFLESHDELIAELAAFTLLGDIESPRVTALAVSIRTLTELFKSDVRNARETSRQRPTFREV